MSKQSAETKDTTATPPKKDKRAKTAAELKPQIKFWATLFPYMKPYRRHLILAIIFSMITGFCVAVQPLIIKYIVDSGIGGEAITLFGREIYVVPDGTDAKTRFILIACAVYVLLSICRVAFWGGGLSNMVRALEGTLFTLRSRFFGHVQRMCLRFYDKNSSGELYNYIMGSPMSNIKTYLHSMIQSVPYQAVSLAISMVALVSYSWQLTLILLLTALVMALLNRHSRKRIRRETQSFLQAEKETSHYITDILHGSEAIKMYSIEDATVERFEGYIDNLKQRGIQYNMSLFLEHLKPELTQYLGIASVYLLGGILCLHNKVTVGMLYAFLSSMGTILGTVSSWLNISLSKNSAAVALERVKHIIDESSTTPEVADSSRRSLQIEKESAIRNGKPCISLEDVCFAYDTKRIFEHLNCDIGYRQSVGLVGGSGSGKSTFTKLIMRLYEVDEGTIRVHGRNVKDFETHELRMSFGVVPQNPFIFYGTIWDNIRIVRPEASNKEIIDAMEVARVHEFVNDLPMGWATVIGDGALGLSGGQKQRIAIARAVLKNPDILIFDEATSALDNISERLIQAAIEDLMKEHTVIIVAHRLSTIRNVNRIIVFDHGKIIQEGTYDELAAEEGEFRRLLDAAEMKSEMTSMDRTLMGL